MSDEPKYVTIKVEAEIDVGLVAGEPIVEGIKFTIGRNSIFIPEPDVSGQMDTQLLETFKRQIAEALSAPSPNPPL